MKRRFGRGPTFSRRQTIAATGAGIAGLAFGRLGFRTAPLIAQTIQIGGSPATPVSPPAPTPAPPAGETVSEVASRLGFDQDAIVAFVRDEIMYEAYDGILRGAQGTLSARAGNSADQAVLLGALLEAAAIPHRYATGALDSPTEAALTGLLGRTSDEVQASWDAADTAALLHHLHLEDVLATPPALDPAIEALVARFQTSAQDAVDLALASVDTSISAIAGALDDGGVTLPMLPGPTLPDTERTQHVWIQVADGPDWIDRDPNLPADIAPAAVTETLAMPPDTWHHWLRFVITADEWQYGAVTRREVVALSAASSRLVDVPVALSMASAGELTEVGLAINQVLTGQKTIYPSIYADGVTVDASTPLIFATNTANAEDVFGDTGTVGIGEGETIAVWLRVEITSPGAEMVVIERPLLDRVPAEDRAAGTVVPDRIAPLQTVPTDIGDDTLEQFNVLTVIHTDVARIPPTDAFVRYSQDQVFGALGTLGPALVGLRDLLGNAVETEAGCWSYPSAPNVTVFHAGARDANGQAMISADLVHRARTSLPLSNATGSATFHPLVLSGVLDAVTEQLLLTPELRGETDEDSSVISGPSVAGVFTAAIAAGQSIRLLTTPAELDAMTVDALSRSLMSAALAAGQVVVVPETPVDLAGGSILGWWMIDPATGRTRDQLATGQAGTTTGVQVRPNALFGNAPGYTFLTRAIMWVAARANAFLCLGVGVMYGAVWATAVIRGMRAGDRDDLAGALRAMGALSLAAPAGAAGAAAVC